MQTIAKPTPFDLVLIALTACIWASAFTAIKVAVPETGPVWLAASRVLIGFMILLPFCLYKGMQWPGSRQELFFVVMVVLLNMAIPFVLISWGQSGVDAGIGALLMGTGPFIALVMSHFFTHDDHITPMKLLAVALGVSGIGFIVGPSALQGLGGGTILFQAAIMAGATCYVIAGLFMRRVTMKPVQFTTLALGIGTVILVAAAFLTEGVPRAVPSNNALVALLWLGAFPTGLAYILRYMLIQKVGMSLFALGMNLIPVLGVILGAVMLNETVTVYTILALCLIMCGLLVARTASGEQ